MGVFGQDKEGGNMKQKLEVRRCLWSLRVGQALGVLLVGLVLVAGIVAPAKAIIDESGPMDLVLDAGAGRLYTSLTLDNRIAVMDVASGQMVQIIPDVGIPGARYERTGIRMLALDEQLERLFAVNSAARRPEGGQDWTLFAIDTTQGTIVQQVLLAGDPPSMPYSRMVADGAHGKLYAVAPEYTTVFDTATLAERTTLPGGQLELLDGESSRLYLANEERLLIINTADDAILAELPLPAKFSWGLALDPSRSRLYVSLEDAIHMLDTTTQEWLGPLTAEPAPGTTMTVDPADGELYFVGPVAGPEENIYHILVLSPETGQLKTTIDFPEPACGGFPGITVRRLIADPAGGRLYGSGNAVSNCGLASYLTFVLDTEGEALLEWLPRSELPDTGGRPAGGGWLVWAGLGLLLVAGSLFRLGHAH
jgi:hypothetical protein